MQVFPVTSLLLLLPLPCVEFACHVLPVSLWVFSGSTELIGRFKLPLGVNGTANDCLSSLWLWPCDESGDWDSLQHALRPHKGRSGRKWMEPLYGLWIFLCYAFYLREWSLVIFIHAYFCPTMQICKISRSLN